MVGSLKGGGKRAVCDIYKLVFVQGPHNLGCVLQNFEIDTAGFQPGMFVDPVATVGKEPEVTIGGNASVIAVGIAEVDFGQIATTGTAYAVADEVPIIMFHWNYGALLRNIPTVDPGADENWGAFYGTTSGTSGTWKADATTGVNLRGQDFVVNGATAPVVAWIEQFSP